MSEFAFPHTTPYINTIPVEDEPPFPGDGELEWRIRSLVRWNAMAMVVRANRREGGIGGHISTYASAATLYEIGFNHFFRGRKSGHNRDLIYFQGHASPGIYARAYLEGRVTSAQLENFRRELHGGLPSYPHPRLMEKFWEFPTVSMGLASILSIYQARFARYLEARGLKPKSDRKIWAFLGDGEMDEPESVGALALAARERLDNLIFVVNCNLQRLDGPVRGNGKIIQELESVFHGAGWRVIKVIWGNDWDPLLKKDQDGLLKRRMEEVVDGQYQRYVVETGAYIRKHFFGTDPRLAELVADLPDDKLRKLRRGGHDPQKIYSAYKAASEHKGGPVVILAKTIKGYGLGEAGEGRNVTHQQKKLNEDELREFRTRFGIPISDEDVAKTPFYRPSDSSPEMKYLRARRESLGGFVPSRVDSVRPVKTPAETLFQEFFKGTSGRGVSTTMAFVRILSKLLRDPKIGRQIVPIIPDEARTFGMEALFRQCGIYSPAGQLYDAVDSESLLYYKESKEGQILEEGITEAGGLSSFIAAGTSSATHGVATIPFFIFYSMFGFQRVGDLIWAAADSRARGFLVGATSGRTTLAGEGLQHQDGQSHLMALAVPSLRAYDPAFAFELTVILRDGLLRMCEKKEECFYYLTVGNENYSQPKMPKSVRDGILKGLYSFQAPRVKRPKAQATLVGSGAIMNETLRAADYLENRLGVATEVMSATSYQQLYRDASSVSRWNRLHPAVKSRAPYMTTCFAGKKGVCVMASDYLKALPMSVAPFIPLPVAVLGTDGFGRSESRKRLREYFEVDWRSIAFSAVSLLMRQKELEAKLVSRAMKDLKIDVRKVSPMDI